MYRIFAIILSVMLFVGCDGGEERWTPDNLTDPYTVDKTYVLDPLGYIDMEQRTAINDLCDSLNTKANLETAVVILDQIDMDPFDFAHKLYNNWRLGQDSRGLLLLIVMDSHKWQFITGYGAEADFPDVMLGRIGNEIMVPEFRNDRYGDGIHMALSEVFKVATDREYKAETYGIVGTKEAAGQITEEEDEEWDYGDWMTLMFTLVLGGPFLSIYICYYGLNNTPLSNVDGKILIYKNKECNVAYLHDNLRVAKWGVWANKKILWTIVIMGVFVWVTLEAFEYTDYEGGETKMDDFMHFLPYITGFFSYSAIWHIIIATFALNSGDTTSKAMLIRSNAIVRSFKLRLYMILAPLVAIPYFLIMKLMVRIYMKKAMKCPACNNKLKNNPEAYTPEGDARKLEVEKGIMEVGYYCCDNGHNTALLIPTRKTKKYLFCTRCRAFSAKITKEEVKAESGFRKRGLIILTATCECCESVITENVKTPKLAELYNVKDESTFFGEGGSYGGGYSSGGGGGSRGGGYSGGGGAGGSW